MLPCNINWNNISLWGFFRISTNVNCNKSKSLQNAIYICFRINPNRWNAKISFEKYSPKPKNTTNKNIFPSAKINSTKCAKFCIFDLFHYLSKVSNNNLYRIRKKKNKKKKKTPKKQTNCHRKTNTKNIEHNALYTPHK